MKKWMTLFLAMLMMTGMLTVFAEEEMIYSDDASGFVLLSDAVPDAILEIRYYSTYNFIGDRIDGYEEPVALLTREAAAALKEVSDELVAKGYRLKIYDAYRPQMAVSHFMRWALDFEDTRMKEYFYPELEKDVLFPLGYIAEQSGHSRGSTVDLTLFDMTTEKEVDMGGTFDYFGELSHPDYTGITEEQYQNRMILREAMLAHGFKPLAEEWWHFTLENEPYPNTYFTFPVSRDSLQSNANAMPGIANPWTDMTKEGLEQVSGVALNVPEDAEDVVFRWLDSENLAEIQFMLDGDEYCFRVKPAVLEAGRLENISGIYYGWENERNITIGHCDGTIGQYQTGSEEWMELCQWYDLAPGLMYSISVYTTKGLDGLDLTAVAEMVYIPMQGDAEPTSEENVLYAAVQREEDSPAWVAALPQAQDAEQLFVVAAMGMYKTTAYITMHQKDENGVWKQILSTPGFVGRNGLVLDADRAEGCGQTPVGVYHFNKAFGIAADPGCAIPYIQVDDNTYWSGDPDRHYNEMVDIRDVPDLVLDDSEHIVDYEYQYQYCLNISFNEDGTPGRGSAIFLHCFGPQKPYTGGCVAIPEYIMKQVMQNVSEDCVVVIDTLENLGGSF